MSNFGWIDGIFAQYEQLYCGNMTGGKSVQVLFSLVLNQSDSTSFNAGGYATYAPPFTVPFATLPGGRPIVGRTIPASLGGNAAGWGYNGQPQFPVTATTSIFIGIGSPAPLFVFGAPPTVFIVDISVENGGNILYATTFTANTSANILYGTGRSFEVQVLDGAMFLISLGPPALR